MSDPLTHVPFEKREIEQSIPARFAKMVARHAERVAVKSGRTAFTYRQLDDARVRIARAIVKARGDRSEPVLLLMTQGAPLIAAILGALSAGRIYVPLKSDTAPDTLARIAADAGAHLVLVDERTLAKARALRRAPGLEDVDVLDVTELASPGTPGAIGAGTRATPVPAPAAPPLPAISPDAPAYIYYTSGTTGPPKGVVDTHRNVLHNIMRYTNNLAIGPPDRLSLVQAPSFSGAVSNVFSALLNGASVHPIDLRRTGDGELADWVNRAGITIWHSVPVIFERLVRAGREHPGVRVVRLEGDRATRRHVELFRARFGRECTLAVGLGTTETGLVAQHRITHETRFDGEAVPIGYALEDMEVFLLDADGRRAAPGKTGEIAVRSRYLARGYWNLPDYTRASFVPDPDTNPDTGEGESADTPAAGDGGPKRTYRTGDLGTMASDGLLTYFGRKHFDVKLWGRRVNVSAIENVLRGIEGVSDAVVIVREDRPGTQQLVAYWTAPLARGEGGARTAPAADGTAALTPAAAELTPGDAAHRAAADGPTVTTLRRELLRQLPDVPVPTRFVKLARIPTGPNEKVDRLALPAPGAERPALDTEFAAPRTPAERTIAACFAEALRLAPGEVGVHDDFHDLGGDSIRAVELALLLEERLATRVSSELFEDSFTVADVAAHFASGVRSPNLVTLREGGDGPPLFLFHNYSGLVLEYRALAAGLDQDTLESGLDQGTLESGLDPDALESGGPASAVTRDRPVLALQYNGEPPAYESSADLAALAAHYVTVVRAAQPRGPYFLAGQCFGGLLAYEAAQQLRAAGEEIALLALIDTACPTSAAARLGNHYSPLRLARRLAGMSPGEAFADFVKRARSGTRFALGVLGRGVLGRGAIGRRVLGRRALTRPTDVHRLAEARYRPRPYDGALVSIVAGEPHNQAPWAELARGGYTLVRLPAQPDVPPDAHLTAEPHLPHLLAALRDLV